jgi:hypothetical protein
MTTIAVEGTIFAFGFSKQYDLSLLPTTGRVFDRRRAFDRFAIVDAHLWLCFSLDLPESCSSPGG